MTHGVRRSEGFIRRLGQPALSYQAWHAEPRRSVIVRLHGIESHAGWYAETSEDLARAGHTVYFVDRRGSGRSEGARGDIDHWSTWLADLATVISDVRWREEVETIHLMANCWGAKPALNFAARWPQRLATVTVIAPALVLRTYYTKLEQAAIAFNYIFRPAHRRRHPVDDPGYFTRDRHRVARIAADPLSLRHCTDRFFGNTRAITNQLWRLLPRLTVPVLALFGGCDQVLDLPRTQELIRRVPPDLLTVRTYPGQWHMLEFEPERPRVMAEIAGWLAASDAQAAGAADAPVMRISDLLR
ncbi:MAG: alpha/beta fold hydrolase [Candidatus Sumerlaeia bacterium]|nr:alpha/beta fold hydrolase [Candidatus Sumerlaeia bacterium]